MFGVEQKRRFDRRHPLFKVVTGSVGSHRKSDIEDTPAQFPDRIVVRWSYDLSQGHRTKSSFSVDGIKLTQQVARQIHHRLIELQSCARTVCSQFKPRATATEQRAASFTDACITAGKSGNSSRSRAINRISSGTFAHAGLDADPAQKPPHN